MFRLGLGSFFLFLPLVFLVFAGGLFLANGIFPGFASCRKREDGFSRSPSCLNFPVLWGFGPTWPEACSPA